MRNREGWMPAARIGLLALAGAIEGLLLSASPVIERYAALRLGPDGVLVDLTLVCVVTLAAVGALAALAPWLQAIFLGLVITSASWSLAESSQHPFWIFSNKGIWRPHAPNPGVVLGHILAIGAVCSAALLDALQNYRQAAREQAIDDNQVARDTRHLAAAGGLALAVTAFIVLPIVAILDRLAGTLTGAFQGRVTLIVLLGSALLLLTGLGLLANPDRTTRKNRGPPTPEAPRL